MEPSNHNWKRIWQIVAKAAAEIEEIARENADIEKSAALDKDSWLDDERLAFSISEVAKLLGKTHTTVRRYIALGRITPIDYPQGQILISKKEIDRFLKVSTKK